METTGGEEAVAELCEGDDLGVALGGVGEEWGEFGGDVLGCEAVLKELGNDAATGDEIGHGDGQIAGGIGHVGELVGIADEALGEGEGQGETRYTTTNGFPTIAARTVAVPLATTEARA